MTFSNDGRNEIRLTNSAGKCLLENWVEERAVAHIDSADVTAAMLFKEGHQRLLTPNPKQPLESGTTLKEAYQPIQQHHFKTKGTKQEALEKMVYAQVSNEIYNPQCDKFVVEEYKSVTQMDYNRDEFVSIKKPPTQHHDLIKEQPVTFWTEHKDRIHSVSQHKMHDTPFRKNAAFSTPIDEYMDQPKPHEQENYPNM